MTAREDLAMWIWRAQIWAQLQQTRAAEISAMVREETDPVCCVLLQEVAARFYAEARGAMLVD